MVSVRKGKRSLPVSWTILNKKGARSLSEQKELLTPFFALLKEYHIMVIGDRKFHSVKLAEWLKKKKISFILRQKKHKYSGEKREILLTIIEINNLREKDDTKGCKSDTRKSKKLQYSDIF
ncbi:MAG: hypothetical protein RLZZ338_2068 [Cyanobacteriota bacterium]|jgi:hypothetical protein